MNRTLVLIVSILICLTIGLFFRTYHLLDWFEYSHDTDLSAWIVKDMVLNGNPRLIGQLTSVPGIFIGGLFYHLLVPLYVFSGFNPAWALLLPTLIGLFSIFSAIYVMSVIHGRKAGFFAGCIQASSFLLIMTEREVVPTTPVFLWSWWYYYCLHLLIRHHHRGLYLAAILFSLAWHIQLNLLVLVLLPAIMFIGSIRKYPLQKIALTILLTVILNLPLLLFEVKHGFIQTQALLSPQSSASVSRTAVEKTTHVLSYLQKNVNAVFWQRPDNVPDSFLPTLLFISLFVLLISRRISLGLGFSLFLWLVITLAIFIIHSINLSEYYLNTLNIVAVILASLTLSLLSRRLSLLVYSVLLVIIVHNFHRLTNHSSNQTGFIPKTELIKYILTDSANRGYRCVSYSFITNPGYELGYRFLTFREGLKLSPISSTVPVYTIVFPHSKVSRIDLSFGSLGLILPDYQNYTPDTANASCSQTDYNQVSPMFGFTN